MIVNNYRFTNRYLNCFTPLPYWGNCGCNAFNSGFGFGILNSIFNFYMPRMNYMFPPIPNPMAFFNPFDNIYSFMNNNYTIPNLPTYTQPLFNYDLSKLYNLSNPFSNLSNSTSTYNNNFDILMNYKKSNKSSTNTQIEFDKNFKNSSKLDANFLNKVKEVAKSLNCDYKDLLAVMNSESGLNPKTWNGKTAVGLIQFTDDSIKELNRVHGLNLTKDKIAKMSAIEQLDLVEKYLKIAKSYTFKANERLSAGDLYAITFLPGRANREVLCTKGERNSNGQLLNYYESNPLDLDGDNKITKSDLEKHLSKKYVNESIFV